MSLAEIIIETIRREGPISFHDFMEMCLYYPELGYYASAQDKTGKKGDYYTSADLGPAFGIMIGRQLEEMWSILGEKAFSIVEYGAGSGFLCHDILDHLKHNKQLYNELNYYIIEKSPAMHEKEKMHLHEKVSWYDSIRDIPEINGCVLSNELIDNLSVHRVVMEDELMEVFVDYKNDFIELLRPAGQALKDYLAELNVMLPKGFSTEINLEAAEWVKEIAGSLKRGYVLTIDYGYCSAELYRESRSQGTLMCYNKHKINDDPYHNIGEQDITTHVNFSALNQWGAKYGLNRCGLIDQARFLLALGLADYLNQAGTHGSNDYMYYLEKAFLKHTLLVDMGMKYKVLIQEKGAPQHTLKGLRLPV